MKLSPSQSGRSMVEIIGVLAVIGVLSIGGIAGYSYGMDKYRANETVNDIMLRATDLLTQANQGHTELSLAEWENEDTIYPIGNADYANDGSVMLDAGTESNPIPKRVCELIFDDVFPHTVQIDTNAVRGVSNAACGDNNVMTFYFDPTGAGPAKCEPACEEGAVCDNGECFKTGKMDGWPGLIGSSCTTDEDCQIGYTGTNCAYCYQKKYCAIKESSRHADCTLSNGTAGLCTYGKCIAKGCTDTNNTCTGKYQYCASPNTSAYEAFPEGETGSCVTADIHRYEINGRVYYVSHNVMSWWHARAFCDALGLDFVPRNELYENGKRTDLTKKLREVSGISAIYGQEHTPSTGLVFVADWKDEITVWVKNAESNGGAVCR